MFSSQIISFLSTPLAFFIFYIVMALLYYKYDNKEPLSIGKYVDYLLPKEIRNKKSFDIDLVWFIVSFTEFPGVISRILSTVFMINFIPSILNSLSFYKAPIILRINNLMDSIGHRSAIIFIIALLSFDLGAYCSHRLAHKIGFLWQFHKAHHYGEQINYMSGGRTHPIDGFFTFNFSILTMALALSIFGPVEPKIFQGYTSYSNTTAWYYYLVIFFPSFLNRLNHSHFPITFGPYLERIFVSPAFHTKHHSKLIINKNFGSYFSIWDSLFDSFVPTGVNTISVDHRNNLGVEGMGDDYYVNIMDWLIKPFKEVFKSTGFFNDSEFKIDKGI